MNFWGRIWNSFKLTCPILVVVKVDHQFLLWCHTHITKSHRFSFHLFIYVADQLDFLAFSNCEQLFISDVAFQHQISILLFKIWRMIGNVKETNHFIPRSSFQFSGIPIYRIDQVNFHKVNYNSCQESFWKWTSWWMIIYFLVWKNWQKKRK